MSAYDVMMDTIHADVANIPRKTKFVGGYVTGPADVRWTAADWARFPHARKAYINQSPDPQPTEGNVTDVEPGAATIAAAVANALRRQKAGRENSCYVSVSEAAALAAAMKAAGVTSCSLWLADWDLDEAKAAARLGTTVDGFPITAVQWASPTSNPRTIVPGGKKTLAEANVDLSVALPSWLAYTAH